ncbi:MAG: hypothetical protein QM718_11880 [Steroidobacteraceae bacterium]
MHSAVQSNETAANTSGNPLPPQGFASPQGSASPQGTRFVINLTSSTTPVALKQPSHPGLKRFTFFVSRRLEEGRERFRMHMGYFESQEEAEKLLDIVREIYPAAWAGVAPGMRLRAGTTPPITGPRATLPAAPQPGPLAAASSAAVPASAPAPEPLSAAVLPPEPLTLSADAPRGAPAFAALPPSPVAARTLPSFELSVDLQLEEPPPVDEAAGALDNVRQAISSLDDTATRAPVLKPLPELKPARSLDDAQVLKVLEPTGTYAAVNTGAQPALASAASATTTTESGDATVIAPAALVAPPATTRRMPVLPAAPPARSALPARSAGTAPVTAPTSAAPGAPRREVAAYAVQLMWSVQPIRVDQVPQLAIFSAYTLYAAEGNRDGRRWYGLRLGFFTDPLSARQVAQYVRSEFSSVSVVPVTARERDRAGAAPVHPTLTAARAEGEVLANSAAPAAGQKDEFKLLDDSGRQKLPPAAAAKMDPRTAALARIAKALPAGAPSTGGKRAKLRPQPAAAAQASAAAQAGAAGAKGKPRRAMTLEETLEVLGADKLEMTQEGGELLSESGVRHLSAQAVRAKRSGSNSRIGRLFERLSERMGGG